MVKKRYAASAVGCSNKKIYLFGGSDNENILVNEIEEYDDQNNSWKIVPVLLSLWNPVEVCASIQISNDKILVFGGCEPHEPNI